MSTQNVFQLAIIGIVLICGYICLLQYVSQRISIRIKTSTLAAVLLLVYAMVLGPAVCIIMSLGSMEMVLFTLLMLLSCVTLYVAVTGLHRNWRCISKGALALMAIYLLALGYVTIFSREYAADTSVFIFRTDLIHRAISTRSVQPLKHMLLNVAMFVPLGFLLPLVCPEKLERCWPVLLLCVMITTLIESLQFFLLLGQADLTDIAANVLGGAIGCGVSRLFRRFYPY